MIQQPEVHLHPGAQAELRSLFGTMVKAQSKRFLVETHSDYIIDRVRMDVRDKKSIRPEDIMILFFEMHKDCADSIRSNSIRRAIWSMLPPLTAGFFCKKNADSLEFKLVCLIIDANMANKFAPTPDDDVKPVIRWLTDSRSRGEIANGGNRDIVGKSRRRVSPVPRS